MMLPGTPIDCVITMYNDVTKDIHCDVTMNNDNAMCTYHRITMHIMMLLFYYVLPYLFMLFYFG